MNPVINFTEKQYAMIWRHLLPDEQDREEAAFAFLRPGDHNPPVYEAIETWLPPREMVSRQQEDYLELSDKAYALVIQQAHRLNASVVEMHSHLGEGAPAFSRFDQYGLSETVPHMWWRLKRRPYFAIVVSRDGFDALAWIDGPRMPTSVEALYVGGRMMHPSGRSLRRWE